MRRSALVVLVCALALLPGCADEDSTPAGAPATGTPTGSPTATASPSLPDGYAKPPKGAAMTVSGTVSAGVESGCLLLTSGGVTYRLHGAAVADLKPGDKVRVEGQVDPDAMSFCQQGTAFTVTKVHPD